MQSRHQHGDLSFPSGALLPFQALGFAPIGRTPRQTRAARGCNAAALLWCVAILATAVFYTGMLQTKSLPTIVSALIFAAELTTNLVNVVQSMVTRRRQAEIPVALAEIDRMLDSVEGAQLQPKHPKQPWRWTWPLYAGAAVMCGAVAIELTYMWLRGDPLLSVHWLQFCYLIVANRMRALQTVFYADALRRRLRRTAAICVASGAGMMREGPNGTGKLLDRLRREEQQASRVLRLKAAYAEQWRLGRRLNVCFGWSLLAIITLNFIHLTTHGYWVFITLQGTLDEDQYADSALDMVAVAVTLGLLCEACHECTETAGEIGAGLNKLANSGDSDGSSEPNEMLAGIVDEFLMQLTLEPIGVSANGFFDINRDLLAALAATTVTYLVILIQFQISEQHKADDA